MPRPIDSHAHIFLHDLHRTARPRYVPDYDAPVEMLGDLLTANGVGRAVLVQPSLLGTDNSYLLAALRAHPRRFRAIIVVPTSIAATEIEALGRQGVVGVRLNLIGQPDPDFATPEWRRHLDALCRAGWLVEVQVEAARLPRIARAILDHGLRLLIDHFGLPDGTLGIEDPGFRFLRDLGAGQCTWVKLSGEYRLAPGQAGAQLARSAAHALLQDMGVDRLLWGSDWPHTQFETVTDYGATRAALARWLPDAALRTRILEDTPMHLFGFDKGA